ncbi:MAG TPA: hypothetical protein VIV40_10355 [Kofleriaceae bacterium]
MSNNENEHPPSRDSLKEIEHRHGRDKIMDAVFICAAVILTALSIGSVTSKAAGKPHDHNWKLTVQEKVIEVGR